LILYHHAAIQLANTFDRFYISHVFCLQNTKADVLTVLAATLALLADITYRLTIVTRHLFCPKYGVEVSEVHTTSTIFELRDWRFSIIDYALHDILPNDPREAVSARRRSAQFYYDAVVKMLYHHSYDSILLRCLSNLKAQEVIKEPHDGICGAHQSGPKLKDRLHRLGYHLPTMIIDAVK